MIETLHFLIPENLGTQPEDFGFFYYDNENGGHLTVFVPMERYDMLTQDDVGIGIIEIEVNNLISSLQKKKVIQSVNEGVRLIPIESSPTINGILELASIN